MHSFAYWKRFGIIKPFDYPWRIVDVGACVGGFVVPFLENLPNATADLFEPWQLCWDYLLHNVKGLPVRVHPEAVAAGRKEITLSYSERFKVMGCPSVYGTGIEARTVQAVALDDVLIGKVDWLKIDVEGYELEVLKGADNILREMHPATIVEIKQVHQVRSGHKASDVVDYMTGCGYDRMTHINANDYLFERKA